MAEPVIRQSFWQRLQDRWLGPAASLQTAVISLRGQRDENQDNYLLLSNKQARLMRDGEPVTLAIPHWPRHRLRVAVFDGMGGHRSGREVAEAAAEAAASLPPQTSAVDTRSAVLQMHQQLSERFGGQSHRQGNPGTTMVWAELDQRSGRGWLASVGDSRVYCSRDGEWQQLTFDQTLAEFNWRDGDLSDADYARLSADGDQRLAQALAYGSWGIRHNDRGMKPFTHHPRLRLDLDHELPVQRQEHADVKPLRLSAGERLLLASDGLWDNASDGDCGGRLQQKNADLAALADAMANTALRDGSRDNVTVLLVGG